MLKIDPQMCTLCAQCLLACPFGAMSMQEKGVEVSHSCKLCGICVKVCPAHAIQLECQPVALLEKTRYQGVLVYAEHFSTEIHPVTFELLGKAVELASAAGDDVSCLIIGHHISSCAQKLVSYGAQRVFVYEHPALEHFKVDTYTAVFEDCLQIAMPSVVLVGATSTGRSLAPRTATRLKTGLTADCTLLERRPNSDLVQIRPAFGGNIMAQILTANHRPQFATVRHKVMTALQPDETRTGEIINCHIPLIALQSDIEILQVKRRPIMQSITNAEVLVVAGRGVREKKDFALLEQLAALLGGQLACTRPMVESGMLHYTQQIGLSGRTVKPKLIIACGVSGAVQFTAGMNTSETIIAINQDKNAPIFQAAHYGFVGDLYEIIPRLLEQLRQEVSKDGVLSAR